VHRIEIITRGNVAPTAELAPGVVLRVFATGSLGASGLTTGTATFRPGAELSYHRHPFSEAITVLAGEPHVLLEGRRYRLRPYDAVHVPAGIAHAVRNASPDTLAVLLSAFASAAPTREPVADRFAVVDHMDSGPDCPEHVTRFDAAPAYELAPGTSFRDLFAGRFGARGICGGHGVFERGASLPCHVHGFDESITIVSGRAVCQVAGREYELSGCDTACIPTGRPHRFLNRSDLPMAMVWVYAGDEPERTLVDPGYCDGSRPFRPGATAKESDV
jgi:quercetin dioxygenase-like cupin family protein